MEKPELALPPLSARSVALSVLLGTKPPRMTAKQLTALGEHFGVASGTMRVALSRMAAAGDLVAIDGDYALAPRHLERQASTDALLEPALAGYDGSWRMLVVVDRGRSAAQRTALRVAMTHARFAELREGVWLRPMNIAGLSEFEPDGAQAFEVRPAEDSHGGRALCEGLWNLDEWSATARSLLAILRSEAEPMHRLTAAAATVRHLRTDPALPEELVPDDWPAGDLRRSYDDYRRELSILIPSGLAPAEPAIPTRSTPRVRRRTA